VVTERTFSYRERLASNIDVKRAEFEGGRRWRSAGGDLGSLRRLTFAYYDVLTTDG